MTASITIPPRLRFDVSSNLRLSAEQAHRLDALAAARSCSRAGVIRAAIDRLLAEVPA